MHSGGAGDETSLVQPRGASAEVVVFDFDGTLVSRDSFIDFSVQYCLRRPARFVLLAAVLPLALVLGARSRAAGASVLLWAMTVGASTRSFVLALKRYARHTLPRYANEAIFEELARHLREGRRVVIATGTVPLLVRGLLRARNVGGVSAVGSRFRQRWGGLISETHCVGRVKVHELQRRLGIVDWSTVYTDSFSDRSLLSRARHITLVSPTDRTLLCTQRLIGPEAALRVLQRRPRNET
jgi:phosphatidylglycerophosphatase C